MAGRALVREALREVAARPRLVFAALGLHVATALVAVGPVSSVLAPLLDGRPAADKMASGDDGLFIELVQDHREILRAALASVEGAVIVYGLLSWILAGGLLAALLPERDARAIGSRAVAAQAGSYAGRMIRVGLFGLPLRLLPLGIAGGLGYLVVHRAIDYGLVVLLLAATGAVAVFGFVWSFVSVMIDAARGLAFSDEQLGAFRAVRMGTRLALRRFGPAARIALFSMLAFALVTGAAFACTIRLDHAIAQTLVRLAAAFARAFVTVATLLAAARLATTAR